MDLKKRVGILEAFYVGIQVDAVRCFSKEGVLEKVTDDKKKEQLALGKRQAEMLGIEKAEDVFIRLPEIFNCASWEIKREEKGFTAENKVCKLCATAKKMGTPSPCHIYCLNPMEGMVKGINTNCTYEVKETLWEAERCRIEVRGR